MNYKSLISFTVFFLLVFLNTIKANEGGSKNLENRLKKKQSEATESQEGIKYDLTNLSKEDIYDIHMKLLNEIYRKDTEINDLDKKRKKYKIATITLGTTFGVLLLPAAALAVLKIIFNILGAELYVPV